MLIPIDEQKPYVKEHSENISKYKFSANTFEMEGNGRTQLEAYLKDNSSLPNWIAFLPSQRTFIINNQERDRTIDELKLKIVAKNINTSVENNFTLIIDPVLREKRLAKELEIKKKEEKLLARIETKNFSELKIKPLKDTLPKYEKEQKLKERKSNLIAKFFKKIIKVFDRSS